MPTLPVSHSCLLFLAVPVAAQTSSVLRISADYHFGEAAVSVEAGQQNAYASTGDVVLRPDLTLSSSLNERKVFPDPSRNVSTSVLDSGTYRVDPDSTMFVDMNPAMPGVDIERMSISADASRVVGARSRVEPDARMWIALRKGSGLSAATLSGEYFLVATTYGYDGSGGLVASVVSGTMTMDGAGGFSLTGEAKSILADGMATTSPFTDAGAYSVTADGGFALSATEIGGVSADGDAFFFTFRDPNEVGLAVAVKKGATITTADIPRAFGLAGLRVEPGAGVGEPRVSTNLGTVEFTASGPTAGNVAGTATLVESDPAGSSIMAAPIAEPFVLQPGSLLRIGTPVGADFQLSAAGNLLLSSDPPSSGAVLFVANHVCGGSTRYGAPTAGTGGFEPDQSMVGFPSLGNGSFGLSVSDGLGGAPGVLFITFAPTLGLPILGGLVHVDTSRTLASAPIALSGPVGAPGAGALEINFPVPTTPSLAGASVFAQTLLFDAGASASLSMTNGLAVRFCRM